MGKDCWIGRGMKPGREINIANFGMANVGFGLIGCLNRFILASWFRSERR